MKNHKSFLAGMLSMLLIMGLIGTASATRAVVQKEIEYRDIKVSLDGTVLDLRDAQGNAVEPFMFDGTNYIPARALAEALGLTVAWDSANSTVVLTHPQAAAPAPSPAPVSGSEEAHAATNEPQQAVPAAAGIRGRSADTIVYVSNASNTIHSVSNCSGMKYYREMTIAEAESNGYDYCKDCW